MNCPSQLMWSMHGDGALDAAETRELEAHARGCAACAELHAALAAERRQLRDALQSTEDVVAPQWHRPLRVLDVLGFGAGIGAAAWLAATVWRELAAWVPAELQWLNPFSLGGLWDLFVRLVFFLTYEGIAMIGTTTVFVSVAMLTGLGAWGLFAILKSRAGTAALLSMLLAVAVLPSPSEALEIRRDTALVSVGAGDTIDDTLVAFGESVSIDGNVNGDLIAFTRSVNVRGRVTGNVITFAQTVTIEGSVDGSVFGFGQSVDLLRARVARDLWGFGRSVTVGSGSEIAGNATLFAANAAMHGRIGRDLHSFSSDLEIGGEIARNVETYAERVRVLAPARIGGTLTTHTGDADNVQTAAGATIVGGTDLQVAEERRERNEYSTVSFYVRQAIRLGAAFVAGLLLIAAFPSLLGITLRSASQALKAGGIGLVAAVSLPIVSIIAFVTIIGIPLGVIGVVLWVLGLYFAKIVVALLIGRRLFATPGGRLPHHAATLIVGLVVVVIAINLPLVGGLANIVLTLVGLGLLVEHLARRSPLRDV